MAQLKDRVQTALDEARMLILGAQVLLGFQYRAVMEKGFESLPRSSQYVKMCGLGVILLAIGLLIVPSAYHRIVNEGEDSKDLHRFTSSVMGLALWPFALGLAIDFYVSMEKLSGQMAGIIAGAVALLAALFFWNGLEIIRRQEREPRIKEKQEMSEKQDEQQDEGSKLKDKIRHVLTEARTVLPGAQALLGFQFISVLSESFDKLPASSKYVHLASIAAVALAMILLMTPAAYHRIVEEGQETEHFHNFASRILVASLVPLALGISGDLFVVVRKVFDSATLAIVASVAVLVFFYGLWFGLTFYRRSQRQGASGREPQFAD